MTQGKSDLELINEFKAGNQQSFEELVSRYSAKAFGLATRMTKNQEDAEEVLQDVFVTVYRKIDGFEGKSSFSSWLYRVTVNASLMKLRKKRRDQSTPIDDVLPQVQTVMAERDGHNYEIDHATFRNELRAVLQQAIEKLPDEYRPVFVLRDIDGLTNKEVSKVLNLTIPAVKSRLHRSRIMLRKRLLSFYREYQDGQIEVDLDKAGNM